MKFFVNSQIDGSTYLGEVDRKLPGSLIVKDLPEGLVKGQIVELNVVPNADGKYVQRAGVESLKLAEGATVADLKIHEKVDIPCPEADAIFAASGTTEQPF